MWLVDIFCQSHLDRIVLAAILGAIIGWEREQHGRPAGLRTHMLVCMGAALMMVISESMYEKYHALGDVTIRVDPGRIAAQIITGIGFIGAGVIMKIGPRVQGLTTAACLWLVAGVGMAVGSGQYLLAGVSTILATFILFYLRKMEKAITRDVYKTLMVWAKNNPRALESLQGILKDFQVRVSRYSFEERLEAGISMYTLNVKMRDPDVVLRVSEAIREKIANVVRLRWE